SGWFSFCGTGGLEPFDVCDRPGPRLPRSDPDVDAHPRPGGVRGRQEAVEQPTAYPLERDERPDLRRRCEGPGAVLVGDREGGDLALRRDGDELRELREALLAEDPRREVVEAARGAPSGEEAALVPKRDEEPLPGEAGCVDVVGLHVPLPGPVPPGVRRPLEEGHRSPSRSGRK